jgi:hypothetical protein
LETRQELSATIVWNFSFTTLPGPQLAVASQSMQFSIWRDAPFTGKRISTVVDSGSVTEINLSTTDTMVVTGTITTSFECTYTRAPGPTHKYFLTAAAGRASGFEVTTNGAPSPITTFTNPTITEVHFSGKVIAPNVAFFT